MRRSIFLKLISVAFVLSVLSSLSSSQTNKGRSTVGGLRHKVLQVRELKACPKSETSLFEIQNVFVQVLGKGRAGMNLEFRPKVEIANGTEFVLNFTKCASYSDQSTCEFFLKFKMKNACSSVVNREGQLWTKVVKSFHPPLRCPLTKQTYSLRNYVPGSISSMFPTFDQFYIISKISWNSDDNKRLACVLLGFDSVTIKN